MIEPTATGSPKWRGAAPPINIHVHGELGEKDRARLLKILEREKPMTLAPKAPPAKPGWQTTEFWVSILATVGAVAAAQQNAVPDRYAAYVAMVSTIAYAISRGLAKH